MGKGDKRTKRGKLFKGTFGKRRVKPQKAREEGQGGGRRTWLSWAGPRRPGCQRSLDSSGR